MKEEIYNLCSVSDVPFNLFYRKFNVTDLLPTDPNILLESTEDEDALRVRRTYQKQNIIQYYEYTRYSNIVKFQDNKGSNYLIRYNNFYNSDIEEIYTFSIQDNKMKKVDISSFDKNIITGIESCYWMCELTSDRMKKVLDKFTIAEKQI